MVVFAFVALVVACSTSVVVFVAEVELGEWGSKEGESGRMNLGVQEAFFFFFDGMSDCVCMCG